MIVGGLLLRVIVGNMLLRVIVGGLLLRVINQSLLATYHQQSLLYFADLNRGFYRRKLSFPSDVLLSYVSRYL
jgi:hypothetical protein